MTTQIPLTSLKQAIDIGTRLSESWFRGQPGPYKNLTPKVFRPEWDDAWMFRGPTLEISIVDEFQRRAPGLSEKVPDPTDHLSWLFLMQHHGAPTRLLDWTESVLTGLLFAVEKEPEADGELWAMFPAGLNVKADVGPGFPMIINPVLQFLVQEAHKPDPTKLVEELRLPRKPDLPVALRPTVSFPRMISQMSMFTIHPSPSHGKSITEALDKEEHLVCYVIPASKKAELQMDLRALGITRRSLFPDLDALSQTIVYEYQHILAYNPPKPPRWDTPA